MYCLTRCYIGKVFNITNIAACDTCLKFCKNLLHIDRLQNANSIFQMIGKPVLFCRCGRLFTQSSLKAIQKRFVIFLQHFILLEYIKGFKPAGINIIICCKKPLLCFLNHSKQFFKCAK